MPGKKRARSVGGKAKRTEIALKIRLDLPGDGQLGPGKIELLRRIGERRSIAAAAREMNMSYRRAWLLVQELNEMFAQPLVAKWLGGESRGGATLTDEGERLVRNYDALVRKAASANRSVLDAILRSMRAA